MEFTFGILWKEIYLLRSHITVSNSYQKKFIQENDLHYRLRS